MKKFVLVLMLPIIIILFSFRTLVFDYDFYETLSTPSAELANVFGYLEGNENLNENFFTQKEIVHLSDVKHLIYTTLIILDILFITALILLGYCLFKKDYSTISSSFILSSILTLVLIFILLVLLRLNFHTSFIYFHRLIFSNTYWVLGKDTVLIKLFNERFFYTFSIKTLLNSVYLSFFIGFLGIGARYGLHSQH